MLLVLIIFQRLLYTETFKSQEEKNRHYQIPKNLVEQQLNLRIFTGKKQALALVNSTNMYIWVVGTSNQLFIKCSYTETKVS